ncbi:dual oxidase maturation factor 1 [Bombina bombina]|uniref:dual oxidase maturation factor 1 n=1 Tax=Bombina bombina TaxID=8345 RepID=UPI00235AD2EE|nr:dual oxidase maturation factor 1 [Bombina bombina]
MIGSSFPFYPRPRTSFIFDIKSIEIITICAVTACTFIIILPGIRGKVRIFWLLKVLISLFIGSVILAVNFTNDWEVGSVTAITAYKSFSSVMVNASIGLLIGLKGINITLTGNPVYQLNETINYNEEFDWGSGNKFAKDYQQSLETGLPNPVLYVAEKFLIDSPCGHHQQYCISAYYTSAIMWVAFCSWIICNVLFCMPVLLYGIFMMFATSFCILLSLLLFAIVRQTPLCKIQFGSSTLTTTFGLSFWLSFATGIICLLISLMLLIIHCRRPQTLRYFFNYDKTGNIPKRPNKEVYTMDNNESIKLHKMF